MSEPHRALPDIDFATFVLSLGSSALIHLGAMEEPGNGESPAIDLPLAKQTIDIIAMLLEKTRGNLTGEESRLAEGLLHDLRVKYVDAAKQSKGR